MLICVKYQETTIIHCLRHVMPIHTSHLVYCAKDFTCKYDDDYALQNYNIKCNRLLVFNT